uniref:Uncharacterized protein n=1 Tax=Monodelphis domestica TaxID=13616 RepID=A0A5F8GJF2_MONDO
MSSHSLKEALLTIKKVCQKKQDGATNAVVKRTAWTLEGKDRFTIRHMYVDIKGQKIRKKG